MKQETDRFRPEMQRYLDGGLPDEEAGSSERLEAETLLRAISAYSKELEIPGPEIDRAVMASIRARDVKETRSLWSWLFQPQSYRVRPVLAAAAVVVLVAAGVLGRSLVGLPSPNAAVTPTAPATVLVRFELMAPEAESVSLAGSFNDWKADAVRLSRDSDSGVWTGTVPLRPGEHQYMFVVDGSVWIPDPDAHAQVDDGFGQTNSVIVVGPRGVIRS